MAEYALIIGGIAIVVIAGILILGPAIRDLFQSTGSSVQTFLEPAAPARSTRGGPRRIGAGLPSICVCSTWRRRELVGSAPAPPSRARRSVRTAPEV